jgi:ribosome modulation factor
MILSDFRLSRIYAEGWRTARNFSASECDVLDSRQAARLNPYPDEPARSRWIEGLNDAMRK